MRLVTITLIALSIFFSHSMFAAGEKSQTAPSDEQHSVMIVLDGSGSMRGKTQGETKMAVAKKVLFKLMKGWDDNTDVGLLAYGHRVKGDCEDIEVIIPVNKYDEAKMIEGISRIHPKGMTPLGASIMRAAVAMRYTEKKATVILISDGKETCHRDPCAIAKELEAKGLHFTAYVIGFDVNKNEQKGLRCIAENTGGKFFEAKNATELQAALGEVIKEVKKTPEYNLMLAALSAKNGPKIDSGLSWVIYQKDNNAGLSEEGRKVVDRSYNAAPKFNLVPGEYEVVVSYGKAKVSQKITIKPDEGLDEKIILGAGKLKLTAITHEGGQQIKSGLSWLILDTKTDFEGNQKVVDRDYHYVGEFKLQPGNYIIKVSYGKAWKKENITVQAGKTTNMTIALNAGALQLNAIAAKNGPAVKSGLNWRILSPETNMEGQHEKIDSSYDRTPKFYLPQGVYIVQVKYGNVTIEKKASVKAGSMSKETFILDAGNIKFTGTTDNGETIKPYKWVILSTKKTIDGDREKVSMSYDTSPRFKLKAGNYIVRMTYQKKDYDSEFTVTPGASKTIVIKTQKMPIKKK